MFNEGSQSKITTFLTRAFIIKILLIFLGLILGFFFGWYLKGESLNKELNSSFDLREKGYEYISPLLDVEPRETTSRKDLVMLENNLNSLINTNINNSEKHITHISVYYKEFSSGAWIGINEKEGFSPASLLKVPVMMAYYKIAESDPSYLSNKIEYQPIDIDVSQNIISSKPLIKGEFYSIEELINKMIIDSDNQAFFLLYGHLRQQDQKKTYLDLGLSFPSEEEPEDFMNVKDYVSFFRILYNASYLSKQMSSKALQLLTKVTFDKGLIAGLPKNIKVAHKYGERGFALNNTKQLHDCGIIYHPKKPYLICIMTRGDKFENLENIIQNISRFVYQAIDK